MCDHVIARPKVKIPYRIAQMSFLLKLIDSFKLILIKISAGLL